MLILISALLGGNASLLIIAGVLVLFNWPWPGRQARAMSLSLREREFINVAQASGEGTAKIVVLEIMPFVLGWALANFINTILVAISAESGPGDYRPLQPQGCHFGHHDLLGHAAPGPAAAKVAVDSLADLCHHAALYRPLSGFHRLVRLFCDEKRSPMIRIKNICTYYRTVQGTVKAVEDVSFDIYDNEIVGIAGESGCGKTSLMKTIYGNVESPMYIADGSVELEVEDMGEKKVIPNQEIHRYWWEYISYIPQASMSVLNPVVRIKDQFLDSYLRPEVRALGKQALLQRMADYLKELELPPEVLNAYPHQLSGGMRQRVIVAMATFVHPKFVLADEPTTALDVVIQRGILTMLMKLQKQLQNTFIIVSHDMGVHYQITDRMVIMYAGKVVEIAPTAVIFERSLHPYTEMLINALPRLGDDRAHRHQRPAAKLVESAQRLPLCRPLLSGRRALPTGGAGPGRSGARTLCGLPPRAGGACGEGMGARMTSAFPGNPRDVSKIYRIGGLIGATKIAAVDHVNLLLEAGRPQILSIVGESGSGKTTLARMIARLIQPTTGEILIDGKSTSGRSEPCADEGVPAQGAADLPEPVRELQQPQDGGHLSV